VRGLNPTPVIVELLELNQAQIEIDLFSGNASIATGSKSTGSSPAKAARRKFGYKRKSFTRS
jgi:hypothetical protein